MREEKPYFFKVNKPSPFKVRKAKAFTSTQSESRLAASGAASLGTPANKDAKDGRRGPKGNFRKRVEHRYNGARL